MSLHACGTLHVSADAHHGLDELQEPDAMQHARKYGWVTVAVGEQVKSPCILATVDAFVEK